MDPGTSMLNSASETKKNWKIQWGKFGRNFLLWLLGIPINVVPVCLKQLNTVTAENFPGIGGLMLMTLTDFDFSFISVSVLFVICIEGYALDRGLPDWYQSFRVWPFVSLCTILMLYFLFFFRPDLFSIMTDKVKVAYNGVMIGATIIFGLFCNAGISTEEG